MFLIPRALQAPRFRENDFSSARRFVALGVTFAIILLFSCSVDASSKHRDRSSFKEIDREVDVAHAAKSTADHEPDFALIEKIYKKSQLHSAAVRKQMNVDTLPPGNAVLSDTRLIWDLFYPDYNCPYGKSRHGRVGDGGKWICGAERFLSKPGCVVYSLGSNAETSFETDMAQETECEIHVFDPTQASVPMPATHRSGIENFHRYAIGNPAHNSTWETRSLEAVMKGFGHTWIDVLKMDIEGGEWEFLDYLLQSRRSIPVGQLLIEFHFSSLPAVLKAFDGLVAQGYRVFNVEFNFIDATRYLEYAFIKVCEPGKGNVPASSWYPRPCEKVQ